MLAKTRDTFNKTRTNIRSSQGRRDITIDQELQDDFEPVRPNMDNADMETNEATSSFDAQYRQVQRSHNSSQPMIMK